MTYMCNNLCVRTPVTMTLDRLYCRVTSSSTDLCSVLDELNEQIVAGGPLMAAV